MRWPACWPQPIAADAPQTQHNKCALSGLHLADGGADGCEDAERMARSRIAELQHRIDELTAMRDALAQLVASCRQPRAKRPCPILDAIGTAADTTTSVTGGHNEN
ncbi:MerR family DNA-binding protein [Mycobacterium xenopi]|uniref:MerR family DNA-binding protein n=1 Tax=Mycobacterium xenopi TaxID=1789 RepID=UPI000A150682